MKIISAALLTLAIISGTAFAKTESMYTDGYSEDINKKTTINFPPSIYKLASQVGEPNFEIFIPTADSKHLSLEGKFKGAAVSEKGAYGNFFTVVTDKGEYSRLGSIGDDSTPSITYTYTPEKLYSVKLDFKKEYYSTAFEKLLKNSLPNNGYKLTKTLTDEKTKEVNAYYEANNKTIILKTWDESNIHRMNINILLTSEVPNIEKVEEVFNKYNDEIIDKSLNELLVPSTTVK